MLVHGTKWCTIRRFYAVRLHLSARGGVFPCSVCPFSTTRLAVRERLWNESRTDFPSMMEKVNLAALVDLIIHMVIHGS